MLKPIPTRYVIHPENISLLKHNFFFLDLYAKQFQYQAYQFLTLFPPTPASIPVPAPNPRFHNQVNVYKYFIYSYRDLRVRPSMYIILVQGFCPYTTCFCGLAACYCQQYAQPKPKHLTKKKLYQTLGQAEGQYSTMRLQFSNRCTSNAILDMHPTLEARVQGSR